jgi:hypothetical protein
MKIMKKERLKEILVGLDYFKIFIDKYLNCDYKIDYGKNINKGSTLKLG